MDKKKGRVEILTFQLEHMMAQKFVNSSGVYYCIVLIRLWTLAAMDFIIMTDWL